MKTLETLYVGALFEKWRNILTDEEEKEIVNKWRLDPMEKRASDYTRQVCIGEATKLILAITDKFHEDITNPDFNKAMEYMLVSIDCDKYHLDLKRAKAELGIKELVNNYILIEQR